MHCIDTRYDYLSLDGFPSLIAVTGLGKLGAIVAQVIQRLWLCKS